MLTWEKIASIFFYCILVPLYLYSWKCNWRRLWIRELPPWNPSHLISFSPSRGRLRSSSEKIPSNGAGRDKEKHRWMSQLLPIPASNSVRPSPQRWIFSILEHVRSCYVPAVCVQHARKHTSPHLHTQALRVFPRKMALSPMLLNARDSNNSKWDLEQMNPISYILE